MQSEAGQRNETAPRTGGERRSRRPKAPKVYPPLHAVTSPNVETDAAAFYLNREPQTLRSWACFDSGPIQPVRINGRLAWSVAELRRLCGVEDALTQ